MPPMLSQAMLLLLLLLRGLKARISRQENPLVEVQHWWSRLPCPTRRHRHERAPAAAPALRWSANDVRPERQQACSAAYDKPVTWRCPLHTERHRKTMTLLLASLFGLSSRRRCFA